MGFKANVLANYAGTGAVALAPLLALPWYLQALGPQQFGLVGFVTMLQALLALVDAGASQGLVREFSVRLDPERRRSRDAAVLLFGLERVYWVTALVLGGVVALLASTIATHWLRLGGLPLSLGTAAVCGAGALFAAQFPGSVYRSVLVGAQAQIPLNAVMLGGALLRHAGAVALLQWWPTVPAYLAWHTAVGVLETVVRGRLAWRAAGLTRAQLAWESDKLRPVWRLLAGLTGAAWLGALTAQMDKVILSRMVALQDFGYYTIASSIAMGVLQLVYPLIQAVLPRAVGMKNDADRLHALSTRLLRWIGAVALGTGVAYALVGHRMLTRWLGDAGAADAIHPVLAILLVGSAMNAFYTVGYIHWLVHGKVGRVLTVNVLGLVLAVMAIAPLVTRFGAIGAAVGWLAINLIGLVVSLEWLTRRRNEGTR